jgi:hypothetical protein
MLAKATWARGAAATALLVLLATQRGAEAASPPGEAKGPAPAPAKAAPSPVVAPAAAAAPTMDGGTFTVQLRDLDQRLEELAEQIRRSRARIALLGDALFIGGGSNSRASLKLDNQLSRAFLVTRVVVLFDGAVQYSKVDQAGELAEQAQIPLYSGLVLPGDHTVQLIVELQGNGSVFPYFRGYKFKVQSTHSFTAIEGKTLNLDTVIYEKGNPTTPFEERPAVRYGEKIVSGISDPSANK